MKKLKNKLVEKDVCVVVISQYREKIGVMFGNPTTTQGGHALKFYSDCRIEISKSLSNAPKDDDGLHIANITKIKTVKNKTAPPFKRCQFNIYYGLGIDRVEELMDAANDLKIGRKYGATYTIDYGTPKANKYDLEDFKLKLKSDDTFYNALRDRVVSLLKGIVEDEIS